MHESERGEKKIMNNNPKVASVNFMHDLIGDSNKGKGFKILIGVLAFLLVIIGVGLIILDAILTGVVLFIIATILVITSMNLKFNRKKYQIDEKKVKDIKPLFKD